MVYAIVTLNATYRKSNIEFGYLPQHKYKPENHEIQCKCTFDPCCNNRFKKLMT